MRHLTVIIRHRVPPPERIKIVNIVHQVNRRVHHHRHRDITHTIIHRRLPGMNDQVKRVRKKEVAAAAVVAVAEKVHRSHPTFIS